VARVVKQTSSSLYVMMTPTVQLNSRQRFL